MVHFAATERVLMALGKANADRQEMHELIRELSMIALEAVRNGKSNPLIQLVVTEPRFLRHLDANELLSLMDARFHVGDASTRAKALSAQIIETMIC